MDTPAIPHDHPAALAQAAAPSRARPRRLRLTPQLRALVRETELAAGDFIYPLFVTHGRQVQNEIKSMPGVFQLSPDMLAREAETLAGLGIPAVMLFGLPATKDPIGLRTSPPMASSSRPSAPSRAPCPS